MSYFRGLQVHNKAVHHMKKKLLIALLLVSVVFVSCFEDLDDNLREATSSEINDFIYRGLNFFYLYKADTPELADDYFADEGEYQSFINSYENPQGFFDYLLGPQDLFSRLFDDYNDIEDALSGIFMTNGMEFGLVFYPDASQNVFGYVRYVLPGSDAEEKGINRGMYFNTIDGIQITEANRLELLEPDSYTIGLATYDGENVTPTGEDITLNKEELTENPIYVNNVFEVNGQKIGYLMYNAFTSEFDSALNAAFGNFKSQGVQHLVLDLRYNGGGSVRTSTYLAGMITGQNTGSTYYTETWNADRQAQYAQDGVFLANFEGGGEAINSLNLETVYVLTTNSTASASELVINGLNPYINVVQIGENTRGKFQASFLLYDAPAPNFAKSQANINHRYAMLPLVFKTANANGNTDFFAGLVPNIIQGEDLTNLGVLGDQQEPLLARAISEINGAPLPTTQGPIINLEQVGDSKSSHPLNELMYR